jgi:hypothetical protein
MRRSFTRRYTKPPTCPLCGDLLGTAATAQNPSVTIRANSLTRCPSCMVLFVVRANMRPSSDLSDDEAAFDAAMNADPEVKEWAVKTLETARICRVSEIKAECVVAREWLVERGAPDLVEDLATLDAYVAGFDEMVITSAPAATRLRAVGILDQMHRQTRH